MASTNTGENGLKKKVHLTNSQSSLLSGPVDECRSASDENCTAGYAAVRAYTRNRSNGEPYLIIPTADRVSPFVQMHPLGWNVNRLILNDLFGLSTFISSPSLVYQNDNEFQNSEDLQTDSFPFVLTNVNVPPENSWFAYTRHVFFDDTTGLAIIAIVNNDEPLTVSQTDSTIGALNHIQKVNMESGCVESTSKYFAYRNITISPDERRCWIPVVIYADASGPRFQTYIDDVTSHEYPPALIADFDGNDASLGESAVQIGHKRTWVTSIVKSSFLFFMHSLELTDDSTWVKNVTFLVEDMRQMPNELKDSLYAQDIVELSVLADEALLNDPVVGQSTAFPVAREDNYRRCKAGECEIGNLLTDALRWKTGSDFAFITSGGLRGRGWEEGDVKISNIWESLPFPNTLCSGKMSGFSMFKLFNFSTASADFLGLNTGSGDLLQVSGVRVTYNTMLQGNRLIKVEIWDENSVSFVPVLRNQIYSFTTDDFLCEVNDPFPRLTGTDLRITGEERGTVVDILHQEVAAEYLSFLRQGNILYEGKIEGRLVNDTNSNIPLFFLETPDSCDNGFYWEENLQSCRPCPPIVDAAFSREYLEFNSTYGVTERPVGGIVFRNGQNFDISFSLESFPSWILFTSIVLNTTNVLENFVNGLPFHLKSGQGVEISFEIDTSSLEPGTALGQLSVGIFDGGSFPGCSGQDETVELFVRVYPEEVSTQIGKFRILGFGLSAIGMLLAFIFATWVGLHRNTAVVRALQPLFLLAICVGVFILVSAIIPIGIDDGFVDAASVDIACMSIPWLIVNGFSLVFCSLYAKLWRINKLFEGQHFRRVKVSERDVAAPFLIMLAVNASMLTALTVVDPVRWVRQPTDGESWVTYGFCTTNGIAGKIIVGLLGAANGILMIMTARQAFMARNISGEFSESRNLGVALFASIQLFAVGLPVLFLISDDDTRARYFLYITLIFSVSMSILLLIFVPLVLVHRSRRTNSRRHGTIISGIDIHDSGAFHSVGAPRGSHSYHVSPKNTTLDDPCLNCDGAASKIAVDERQKDQLRAPPRTESVIEEPSLNKDDEGNV